VEARRRTWFDDRGLTIAGAGGERRLPFFCGAMHYWRVEPKRWAACLGAMRELGLVLVETYVPWRVHERDPGDVRWDRERDLGKFLELARAAGLGVVLRPGPHINAELTSFGMPDHVLAEPALQARTARGTPVFMPSPPRAWPVPSYACAAFRERVAGWYAAFAEVVRPHLAPDGAVVALGIDNEAQMFFRLGAYDHDYHPESITWWRDASGLEGDAPRAWLPDDPARCISWVRFKDQYIARALHEFGKLLDGVRLAGLARFHNLPPGPHALYDLRGLQRAIGGPVGIDAYSPRSDFRELRRRALACVGNAQPLPIAFEVGVGFFPWFPPLDAGDDPLRERDHLLTLLAAGTRGFNLFMAVERDRYYGAAIDKHGKRAEHAAWIRPLVDALAAVDWPALRRTAPIAVIDARTDTRFGQATCLIDPMTPVVSELLGLGPGGAAELGTDPAAIVARRWSTQVQNALDLAQVPYVLVDESATAEELAHYRAVIAPTLDRIDRGLSRTLHALAETKHTVIVIGPSMPTRDELDQPLAEALPRRVGRLKDGSLDDLPGLAADVAALVDPPDAWQIERPDDVRAFAHADAAGVVRVVFVASDADRAVSAVLLVAAETRVLRDPITREVLRIVDGKATVPVHARGVRILLVE